MTLLQALLDGTILAGAFRVVSLALVAAVATALVAFFYRVRTGQQFPEGPTVLIGLGTVALILNTRLILVQFVGDGDALTQTEAIVNVIVFVAAGAASYGGRRAGERLGTSERVTSGRFQPDFSPLVRAVGRFITVTLPEDIDDIDGYDPVSEDTKKALSGKAFDFPRGMTVATLKTQLVTRLREEHDVGYVDVELADDGSVEYLAVGQRVAGLGPTLPPKSAAVAIRADPPLTASPGDTVQIWRVSEGTEERVGTAELRTTVGSVVTLVADESLARKLDPTVEYRLLTLAADSYPDKEFAAMLRREDETMSIVELDAGSPLVGKSVGSLETTLIAIRGVEGEIDTIPKRSRTLAAGETLFAIGKPDVLRRLELLKGTTTTDSPIPPEAATPKPLDD